MGLFDFITHALGGATENLQAPIEDALGGAINPDELIQGVQENIGGAAEQGQTAVEDIKQNLGL